MNNATLEAPSVDLEVKPEAKKRQFIKVELAEGGQAKVPIIEVISHESLHPPFDLDPNETVEVLLRNGTIKRECFYECLLSIGIDSMDFYHGRTEFAKETNFHDLLQRLHIEKLRQREVDSKIKHKEFTDQFTLSGEQQRRTTKEHGVVWQKIINDLNIPGLRAVEARAVEDYFEGIDEFLVLDMEALKSRGARSGELVRIGVQRSFSNKQQQVRDSHNRGIAERPDLGVMFRVFIREEVHQYEGVFEKLQATVGKSLENVTAEAEKAGMTEAEYRQAILEKVSIQRFIGSPKVHLRRVYEILKVTKNELELYLSTEQIDALKEKLKQDIKAVDAALEEVGRKMGQLRD